MPKHYRLTDYKDRQRENEIIIETEGGNFTIPPPELWTDEILEVVEKGDAIPSARVLLGDRYDAFVDAGGSAALVMAIVKDAHGGSAPE